MANTQNEQHTKKIPQRRCVGCGGSRPKSELVRVVRKPDGSVVLDATGKVSGRGAYLCHDLACFGKARKAKRLEHNLACVIPEDVYQALEEAFKGGTD